MKTSRLWKIYFGFVMLLYLIFLSHFIRKPSFSTAIDMLVNTVTETALFGFAFHKKLLVKRFWQITFYGALMTDIVENFSSLSQVSGDVGASLGGRIVWCAVIAPIYVGFFKYAFKSDAWWASIPVFEVERG